MRIKHFAVFKNKMETLNWEKLRNDENEGPYYLPHNKEDYLLKVDTAKPSGLTQIILQEIKKTGLAKIFSLGSGIASQEYQLKKFSDGPVVVTDNNSSVLRLKRFEIFDNALILDAFKDSLPVDENWIVLFPRIDTECDDNQLKILFKKCYDSGVKYIIFIPAELLSLRIIFAELKTLLISLIKRRPRVFCGYARSLKAFKKIWEPFYILSKNYKMDNSVMILEAKQS
jgi:hypothetical protein